MSKRRNRGELSGEDRILWSTIARTVEPMHGKSWPPRPETPDPQSRHKHGAPSLVTPVAHPPYQEPQKRPQSQSTVAAIDMPTRKKLSKGRVSIDATIDLHDLDQAEAHGTLLAFLHQAHASNLRHVLVVTGKGSSLGSAGVLRRAVPHWLATAPFRGLVSGFDNAARHHGGAGAIYVRLSRKGNRG